MCGICAYIGFESGYKQIYYGLCMLQNRGYDSAGISGVTDKNEFIVRKYASRDDKNALELLANMDVIYNYCSTIIGHSRWACQGAKTDLNAHPHMDYSNTFSLVHNGIIENYEEIRNELLENHGIMSKSQTDTEVIVNLIGYYYSSVKNSELAIRLALNRLSGTWGLVILNRFEPDKLFCARHGSPLLIGLSDDLSFAMVASEQTGFSKYVSKYICLNDDDLVVLDKEDNGRICFKKGGQYEIKDVNAADKDLILSDIYKHWTLKEIYEQPQVVKRTIGMGGRIYESNNNWFAKLGGLERVQGALSKTDNLIVLGCGTSYNAGLHVLPFFKKISGFNTCSIFDGAEFKKDDIPKNGITSVILLSQSGETRDLYECLAICKNEGIENTIGIVNVVDSMIAREVSCGVYLNAGKEIGVASTKVFLAQVIVLYLVALWFCQIKTPMLFVEERNSTIQDIIKLSDDVTNILETCFDKSYEVAKYLVDKTSLFILGKGLSEAIALEGSLKIKEIGYVHAEGYSSSALKHGPYSLIEKGTPIIIITPEDSYKINNRIVIDEVNARGGYTINIGCSQNDSACSNIIVTNNKTFSSLLAVIPMQIIAYYLSVLKGNNPDLPRNLAKTVSVS
jgi:glutamine---fructose-6-phosphate transaminase (isomerizing)